MFDFNEIIDDETEVIAYKGFNKDMTCRGFHYEEGQTYEAESAKICESGFHACIYPLDVFNYYSPANSVFHKVKLSGKFSKCKEDSKIAATRITILEELTPQDLQNESEKYIAEHLNLNKSMNRTGNYSSSSNTGDCSSSSNTGYRCISSNTGYRSSSSNTGNSSISSNTGECSISSNSGNYSISSNTGDRTGSSNTGKFSISSNTGDKSNSSNTGNCSISSNTGYHGSVVVDGENSVGVAWGYQSRAKGILGSTLVFASWTYLENRPDLLFDLQRKNYLKFNGSKTIFIDGENYKANTWYTMVDDKVVEWTSEIYENDYNDYLD